MATGTGTLIRLLDYVDALPSATKIRMRSYELLGLPSSARVADVGCGAGRSVHEMAAVGARAVGVDPDEQMIAAARDRWPEAEFRVAGADRLPFDDATLDGYRADKVFHMLEDPAAALAEARRVLAPGGRIVLLGQDWDTTVVDTDDIALARAVLHARADAVANPLAARGYRRMLLDAGFEDVHAEVPCLIYTDPAALALVANAAEQAHSAGGITRDQADEWIADQRKRAEDGRLFVCIPIFVAAGTRR